MEFLKNLGPKARTWLSKFFSRITATHSVLKIWRKAKAIAVEKPGKDLSLAANYRPISLLSVCYKLLERLVLQRISPTVVCLLNPDQAGFQKGWSTCDQVAAPTTFIENGFQQNQKTGAVFLDLMAAYDTVWHSGLLYKLSKSMPYWLWRFAMQQSTAPQSGHALLTQVRSMCSWTLPCVSSLVPSVLHFSHGFQCSPILNRQPYEGRLPLTSRWRKSSNMTVGQSSLISLAHHCYDWHPGSHCG